MRVADQIHPFHSHSPLICILCLYFQVYFIPVCLSILSSQPPSKRKNCRPAPARERAGALFRLPQNRGNPQEQPGRRARKETRCAYDEPGVKTARLRRRAVSRKTAAKKKGPVRTGPSLLRHAPGMPKKRADGATDPINNGISVTKSRTFLKSPGFRNKAVGFCRATTQSTSQKRFASSPRPRSNPLHEACRYDVQLYSVLQWRPYVNFILKKNFKMDKKYRIIANICKKMGLKGNSVPLKYQYFAEMVGFCFTF